MEAQHISNKKLVKSLDDNVISANPKKRRAAFEDITNDGYSLAGSKKKLVKKDLDVLKKSSQSRDDVARTLHADITNETKTEQLILNPAPTLKLSEGESPVKEVVIDIDEREPGSADRRMDVDASVSELNCFEGDPDEPKKTDIEDQIMDLCEQLDWIDVDKENEHVLFYVTEYVNDIFSYYKEREAMFVVSNYLSKQSEMTVNMRAILVDWMDEVQQNFELSHETLYLGVKLVDLYLSVEDVAKSRLQLVGATALNVASKFEERCPPVLDDYIFICDDAYTREEILEMERNLLVAVGFDIGFPLSYTFLRRYAQCARVSIKTLTCARYILEMSLMEFCYIEHRESEMAAACLLLAMKMTNEGQWDGTMIHYTDYNVDKLAALARSLNSMLISPPQKTLTTIKNKYLHEVFHEVAILPPVSDVDLNELLGSGVC